MKRRQPQRRRGDLTAASGESGRADTCARLYAHAFTLLFTQSAKGKEAASLLLSDINAHLHTLPVLPALAATARRGLGDTQRRSPPFPLISLKGACRHLGSLQAREKVEEKLFLIVINIQRKQTICFQITAMPSLPFPYQRCWEDLREPSGRPARGRELTHNRSSISKQKKEASEELNQSIFNTEVLETRQLAGS